MDVHGMHMKESGMRIRLEPELRQEFMKVCREADQTAAQVIRGFMRSYIEQSRLNKKNELFLVKTSNRIK